MPDKQLLNDAISRNAALVLSLPSSGMLRHLKSRFLFQDGDAFWVECDPSEQKLVEELIAAQQPVGVAFKSGKLKTFFTTPVVARRAEFHINAEMSVEAIL